MKTLITVLILLFPVLVQGGFYVWYDTNGAKHVSTHPPECIEGNSLTVACRIGVRPQGNPDKVAETMASIEANNNGWADCGRPGEVYVGERLAIDFLEEIGTETLVGSAAILRFAPVIGRAEEKARLTCENVYLTFDFDKQGYDRAIEKREQKQIKNDIADIKRKLRGY